MKFERRRSLKLSNNCFHHISKKKRWEKYFQYFLFVEIFLSMILQMKQAALKCRQLQTQRRKIGFRNNKHIQFIYVNKHHRQIKCLSEIQTSLLSSQFVINVTQHQIKIQIKVIKCPANQYGTSMLNTKSIRQKGPVRIIDKMT